MTGKFTFFGSFYEAFSDFPDDERLALYDAVMAYVFDGIEPQLSGFAATVWKLVKPNVDMSLKRSRTNADNAAKATENDRENDRESETEATASKDKDKDKDRDKDREEEKERDRERREGRGASERHRPPFSASDEDAEFGAAALEAFNRITGSGIQCLSPSDWTRLSRIRASGRTLGDVEAVVRSKLDEWGGDAKMGRYVRPSTLFGQKFEEYLSAARKQEAVADEFAEYD